MVSDDIFEIHGHHFSPMLASADNFLEAIFGPAVAAVIDLGREQNLASISSGGVTGTVVMGNRDYTYDNMVRSGPEISEDVFNISSVDPTFFHPFYQFFPDTELTADTVSDIPCFLDAGFEGIGELYPHAYEFSIDDGPELDLLAEVIYEAALAGVPVSMHWNCTSVESGSGDGPAGRTAADNQASLTLLIDKVRTLLGGTATAKIILCHCGVGPGDPNDPDKVSSDDLAVFETWLTTLLTDYPEVYFDLAGLQVGDGMKKDAYDVLYSSTTGDLTDFGTFLAGLIVDYPERFLVGSDVDNRSATEWQDSRANWNWGVDAYVASYDYYRTFLGLTTLDPTDRAKVLSTNATGLLGL